MAVFLVCTLQTLSLNLPMHQPQLRHYKSREVIEMIEEDWTEQRELIIRGCL